jgi:PAS domain S-box-containing protein
MPHGDKKKLKVEPQNIDVLAKELLCDVVMKNTPIAFYWCNLDGIMLGCNDLELKVLGLKTKEDFIGKHATETGCSTEAWNNYRKVMEDGVSQVFEETYQISDKLEQHFLSIKAPIRDSHKEIIGMLGASIDVTDRKQAEKLKIEKEAAEKLAKTMEMVSGFIAHEIKTPLAIINLNNDLFGIDLNSLDLTFDSKEGRDKMRYYHDNIQFAVYNADNIIGMLLTKISSLAMHKIEPKDFTIASMQETIDTVLKEYPFLRDERKLVNWNAKSNKDFQYFGKDFFTKHVLFNLIKNAFRAIKEYDQGEIFITLKEGDKFNYLIFKDTGMGISEEHLPNLFQQFNSHMEGGTGLGLSFCKMVMKSYGGDITCRSKEREYTEFKLAFPKDGGTVTTLRQKVSSRNLK